MKFNFRGENIRLTTPLKEYAEKKINKLEKYFDNFPNVVVSINMKVFQNEQQVEVTIFLQKLMLRAEESHSDLYAAIDLVIEKLEKQVRKHKTKINRRFRQAREHRYSSQHGYGSATVVLERVEEEEENFEIVRAKRFHLKPMDTDEAILQMSMLGHNFFVFSDAESGTTNVVYKRKDGKYGLILPN